MMTPVINLPVSSEIAAKTTRLKSEQKKRRNA